MGGYRAGAAVGVASLECLPVPVVFPVVEPVSAHPEVTVVAEPDPLAGATITRMCAMRTVLLLRPEPLGRERGGAIRR
jgi:hypothetical protein